MSSLDATAFDLRVLTRTPAADGVVLLELGTVDGTPLPSWLPGSHVDVILPSGDARQYSLCGEPGAATWRIGVLREADGRGGSLWLSDTVIAGDIVRVAGPRNHFEFVPERGTRYVFIAGGIGITPLRRMLDAAAAGGVDYELHYAGRSRATMALLDEVLDAHPGRVTVYAADEGARLDLAALYGDMAPFTTTYCCGPARLIEAVEAAAVGRQVKVERFEPIQFGEPVWAEPFEIELAFSGETLVVPPERSVLDVLEENGTLVLSSCREGTCGTCETRVMEGEIEHRDSILSPDQQAANDVFYPCVSRASCPRLVLEL